MRKATVADRPALVQVLARAFDDDPFIGWMCRKDARRREAIARFMRVGLDGITGPYDETYTHDDLSGAAAWVPPGRWKLGFWRQLLLLPDMVRAASLPRAPAVFAATSEVTRHHPTAPHWYLFLLGVEPERQGQGLGSALLRPALERCDRERVGAYLETATERNVTFYRRHGFRVAEELRVRDAPILWLMWRDPA